jgi:MoxR-like ATPase
MDQTISRVNQQNDVYAAIDSWRHYLNQRILGQANLIDRLLIAVLCDGHLLIEGAPGLAKTKVIRELARGLDAKFKRIQFTGLKRVRLIFNQGLSSINLF